MSFLADCYRLRWSASVTINRYGTIMVAEGCGGGTTSIISAFSGPDVTYEGIEFGSADNDNAGIITENMVRADGRVIIFSQLAD